MILNEIIMIFAVLLAPVIAVQVSQYLDRDRQKRDGRLKIFKKLMATRASQLAPAHVEALNMIDVEFYGNNKKDKDVTIAWKAYIDHLTDENYPKESWHIKKTDLLIELLYIMAKSLNYNFDKTHIKNTSYFPKGYGELEDDQFILRKGFLALMSGEKSLSVQIDKKT